MTTDRAEAVSLARNALHDEPVSIKDVRTLAQAVIELDAELRLLEAAQQEPVCKFCGGTGFSGISDPCICQFSNAAQQAQAGEYKRLTKAAMVGNTIFRAGVSERLVVECAQRRFKYRQDAEVAQEPVAAQHRFRHPQKTRTDWSIWQPARIDKSRPPWAIDSQGYEVEYRLLYTIPPTNSAAMLRAAGICRRIANENDGIVVGFNLYSEAASDCADAIEQALRATPADVVADGYYVQDSRQTIGNDMLFWRHGGNGYTTNLREAGVYSLDDAVRMHRSRDTDIPWPKAYIDSISRPAVDFQYADKKKSMIAAAKEKENE